MILGQELITITSHTVSCRVVLDAWLVSDRLTVRVQGHVSAGPADHNNTFYFYISYSKASADKLVLRFTATTHLQYNGSCLVSLSLDLGSRKPVNTAAAMGLLWDPRRQRIQD